MKRSHSKVDGRRTPRLRLQRKTIDKTNKLRMLALGDPKLVDPPEPAGGLVLVEGEMSVLEGPEMSEGGIVTGVVKVSVGGGRWIMLVTE